MKSLSKIISGGDSVRAWAKPNIDSRAPKKRDEQKEAEQAALKAEQARKEIEALRLQGYSEGYEKGQQAALAEAEKEREAFRNQIATLLNAFAEPLELLEAGVEEELVNLSVAIARQIVRRELKTEPAQVVGVVKEALTVLPSAVQNIKVHLHPNDARLVTEIMLANIDERKWEVVEDPIMEPGGCRIDTDTATVDATIDSRIAAIAARLLGGERAEDE